MCSSTLQVPEIILPRKADHWGCTFIMVFESKCWKDQDILLAWLLCKLFYCWAQGEQTSLWTVTGEWAFPELTWSVLSLLDGGDHLMEEVWSSDHSWSQPGTTWWFNKQKQRIHNQVITIITTYEVCHFANILNILQHFFNFCC